MHWEDESRVAVSDHTLIVCFILLIRFRLLIADVFMIFTTAGAHGPRVLADISTVITPIFYSQSPQWFRGNEFSNICQLLWSFWIRTILFQYGTPKFHVDRLIMCNVCPIRRSKFSQRCLKIAVWIESPFNGGPADADDAIANWYRCVRTSDSVADSEMRVGGRHWYRNTLCTQFSMFGDRSF